MKHIWYIEARSADDPSIAPPDAVRRTRGSAVSIRLQKNGDPHSAATYLITSAHGIRDDGGYGPVLPHIFAWQGEAAHNVNLAHRVKIAQSVKQLDTNAVPVALRNDAAGDWVILEFEDPVMRNSADAVALWADVLPQGEYQIAGFPGGDNAFLLDGVVKPVLRDGDFTFHAVQNGVLTLLGSQARPGDSGGGVFVKETGAFAGVHRGRYDAGLQVRAVSAPAIIARLSETGWRPAAAVAPPTPDVPTPTPSAPGVPQNGALLELHAVYREFRSEFDKIETYKTLHDQLHECVMLRFGDLYEVGANFELEQLKKHAKAIREKCAFARTWITDLPDDSGVQKQDELAWIDGLSGYATTIIEMISQSQAFDESAAMEAINKIRSLIRRQMANLNDRLTNIANTLPTDTLASNLEGILEAEIPDADQEREKLTITLAWLREDFSVKVEKRVTEHDHWQYVHSQLNVVEGILLSGVSDPDALGRIWGRARAAVDEACAFAPDNIYSIDIQEKVVEFEAVLPDGDIGPTVERFGKVRSAVLQRFYKVDSNFLGYCKMLVRNAPIANLLKELGNDA